MLLKQASLTDMLNSRGEPAGLLEESLNRFRQRLGIVEPQIHAFVAEPDAEERLARDKNLLLQSCSSAEDLPPLFGVPVAVKDLLHADGLLTRAGSPLPPALITGEEGSLVKRLRALGAFIAGKTVTEEFAYNGPVATRNPHNPDHTPGGSSAGSAAAVAAGICPLAVGTQTLRSVIAPASFCGIVGFKPSYGRVPLDGVLLLSPSMDTIGFFTQDLPGMEYAAALLVPDWQARAEDALRKPVLGIPKGVYMELMSPEVKAAFLDRIAALEQLGYEIRNVQMPWEDEFIYGNAMLRFIEGELARGHEQWFGKHAQDYGRPVHDAILRGKEVSEEELDGYRNGQQVLRAGLKDLMAGEGIDLWISPAQGGTAPRVEEMNTGWSGMPAVWGFAGLPSISLPAVTIGNMPLGIQCIGSFGEDETLLAWARVLWPHLSGN
ncbi:amidase [Paenibacillus sp. MMS20-IR301]|uniref:amidase n=1 Tax=Paenibacillus sp. MMS20-IR301 TaxID=2895946 RepID=UPI0028F077DC|nr:amidase [Paenibacillus sp. MMS20-IR301]WNS46291.1 amidase [Paenibacillus sp. MMS20-IR301]